MATPRSLSNRLRQHSRRSGFAVGASMALAIAVCIAGFITIYVQLQPYISDFVTEDAPGEQDRVAAAPNPTEPPSDDAEQVEPSARTEATVQQNEATTAPEEAPPEEAEPEPTQESDEFEPNLQIGTETGIAIRLRSEPTTAGGEATVLENLEPATPIQSTGDTSPSQDPANEGLIWIEVRTADGLEGWIREIDSEPFSE